MLLQLEAAGGGGGYRLAHLPEAFAHGRVAAAPPGAPLPAFEEIARGNLLLDQRDARLLGVGGS
jgi:hypothetical protein